MFNQFHFSKEFQDKGVSLDWWWPWIDCGAAAFWIENSVEDPDPFFVAGSVLYRTCDFSNTLVGDIAGDVQHRTRIQIKLRFFYCIFKLKYSFTAIEWTSIYRTWHRLVIRNWFTILLFIMYNLRLAPAMKWKTRSQWDFWWGGKSIF